MIILLLIFLLIHIFYNRKRHICSYLGLRIIGRLGDRVNAILVESSQGIRKQLEVTNVSRGIIRRVLRMHREREERELLQSLMCLRA